MKTRCRIERRPVLAELPWPADLHPVLRRVYARRPLRGVAELDHGLMGLLDADRLSGLARAVELLEAALAGRRRILVVGDFDADGATAAALAVRGLRALGAAEVDVLVPDRFRFGYGLSPEIVAVAAERRPDLLITVDNGVSSIEGVAAARAAGMQVIVTDHHLPGERLPEADAIVNPNLPGDPFPSKHLAGVGVMFYVLAALRRALREAGAFGAGEAPNLARHLDLVALGTVADVVPLDHNNRILVEQGLRRIRAGRACPGVEALLRIGGADPAAVTATDLGFVAAPRLNAAGRLEDMSLGIACLLSDDSARAWALAERLDALNRERRAIEAQMRAEAETLLDARADRLAEEAPAGVVLYDPGWHQGVAGILAARLRERLHRPVIVCTDAGDGRLKGSARSVPGLNVRDLLAEIDARRPGLIERFGGHAMAAGLTLAAERLEAFQAAFAEAAAAHLGERAGEGVILSDGELADHELVYETAAALAAAGPWGAGFPEPQFDGRFTLRAQRVVGERHLRLDVAPLGSDRRLGAIAFGRPPLEAAPGALLRLVYRLEIDRYNGGRGVQLNVQHLELES